MGYRYKTPTVDAGLKEGWFMPNTNGGKCHCGCGNNTIRASATSRKKGVIKNQLLRFIFNHHYSGARAPMYGKRGDKAPMYGISGNKHPGWRGGVKNSRGYVEIWLPANHMYRSMASKAGYVREHRLVMAIHLKRALEPTEIVHHKNNIRNDNRLENLEITTNETNLLYATERARLAERLLKYFEKMHIDPELYMLRETA